MSTVYLYVFYFVLCCLASVSACWQRGITAPGIESSSQAFGWRSTSQMKMMLVHLKVAAELPVDAFAVTLSVIFIILAGLGFFFKDFYDKSVAFVFVFWFCCLQLCF